MTPKKTEEERADLLIWRKRTNERLSRSEARANPIERTCKLCGEIKPLTPEFFGRTRGYFRHQCRTCSNSKNAKWQKENKDKVLANSKRRQSLVANAVGDLNVRGSTIALTREQLIFLYQKTGGVCIYCSKKICIKDAQPDHKTPVSRGGTNYLDNIELICGFCNREKKDRTVKEYLHYREKHYA